MHVVRLAHETDFDGWRQAARGLRARKVPPEAALWTVDGEATLFGNAAEPVQPTDIRADFRVPKAFVDLAARVILHRSNERFTLLYRLLWRLHDERDLMHIASDPDVARANHFAKEVSRAAHKMKAFVRFRLAADEGGEAYVAWFEPAHRVAEATAPFFARRYANMRFSILTPDACVHWDMVELSFTAGADPADAPSEDALEDYWRTYYASIFNPARLKVGAMQMEMPKRYWRNLPEAALIPELIAQAQGRTDTMVRQAPTEPNRRVVKTAVRNSRDAPWDGQAPTSLAEVAAGVDHCRRCDFWRDATQGVPGEGPPGARLLFVGEQPGDQEDLAGKPFIGPAGQVFDRALAEAGVPRTETYVTNAVKHFKHELRGKRRIHKTPDAGEVAACRWWLDAERRIVRPRVVVALGATAGLAVFGKPTPIGKLRGQALQLSDQAQGVVTYHPSYLLRLPDAAAKAEAYAMFVEDLRYAWALAA
ncbi:MAG: uracil-DNA glycosylase [Phenylobacterium sp. RIFCSPHIGHO2_01_FULL_69_31]|uniref:UdgX family uracil-DNA binding protein n=1 Tax=Phenylobacterium sp. RIFCSPHIGHO2_01_FULL_69_31 TaxID=1801944 RepID=UPI0008D37F1A|nr:UdgX family uracil-DNA binding protein [Phenylobacterium sp. RIFCSPHIGHO2_01_FULL_69_31]OHB28914.1 MAG: uracil-DNA glycosylase [Phenylobacterium sp. RIFCSPHIGHO2_01_FULL_69_31]